jgi:hypothetical protein
MEELIARAKEMCSPPQPCIYDKLAWRKVVLALVDEIERLELAYESAMQSLEGRD